MAHKFVGGSVDARAIRYQEQIDADQEGHRERLGGVLTRRGAVSTRGRFVRDGNRYIDEQKPWALAKKPESSTALHGVLGRLLRDAALGGAHGRARDARRPPREILRQLGREQDEGHWPDKWGWPGGVLTEPKPVFPRVEPERQAALIDRWSGGSRRRAADAGALPGRGRQARNAADISYDDFAEAGAARRQGDRPPSAFPRPTSC